MEGVYLIAGGLVAVLGLLAGGETAAYLYVLSLLVGMFNIAQAVAKRK